MFAYMREESHRRVHGANGSWKGHEVADVEQWKREWRGEMTSILCPKMIPSTCLVKVVLKFRWELELATSYENVFSVASGQMNPAEPRGVTNTYYLRADRHSAGGRGTNNLRRCFRLSLAHHGTTYYLLDYIPGLLAMGTHYGRSFPLSGSKPRRTELRNRIWTPCSSLCKQVSRWWCDGCDRH